MNKNLLIEIFVPRRGGGGNIATAYPVAKDRILTARHALFPADRDESKPIEARWYHRRTDPAYNWKTINRIAWDGGDGCDAAVIDCAFPSENTSCCALTDGKPSDHMQWSSEGFAEAGQRDDDSRSSIPMLGRVFGAADTEPEFWLGADYKVAVDSSWAGASGSPVFVDGKIIGVIVSCPENFDRGRLKATPVWKLLADPAFCDEIGYGDRIERLKKVKREIARALRGSIDTMDAFNDVDVAHREAEDRATNLADQLTELRIDQAIDELKKAYRSLRDADPPKHDATIRAVAQWLIPAVFDPAVIQWLDIQKNSFSAALVAFPAATRTVAEILMAGVDVRQIRVLSSIKDGDWPEGKFCLPMPPETGLDEDGNGFKETFDTHLINVFTGPVMRAERNREALLKIVANELDYRAREEAETYYFIYSPPSDIEKSSGLQTAVEQLKKQYPSIIFIQLRQDDDLLIWETNLLRPVRDLLCADGTEM